MRWQCDCAHAPEFHQRQRGCTVFGCKCTHSRESGAKPDVEALIARGNITTEEMRAIRANSYEWERIFPKLSDEALIEHTQYVLKNCTRARSPAVTYDEALQDTIVPLLIGRLIEKNYRIDVAANYLCNLNCTGALRALRESEKCGEAVGCQQLKPAGSRFCVACKDEYERDPDAFK